jgi:hypothetical protein
MIVVKKNFCMVHYLMNINDKKLRHLVMRLCFAVCWSGALLWIAFNIK